MKLYFLRHASASDVAPSDAERKLTKEGEEEARIAGAALAELGVKPAHIFSSPLVRARQTAEIAARELEFSGDIEILDELLERHAHARLAQGAETLRRRQRAFAGRPHAQSFRTHRRVHRRQIGGRIAAGQRRRGMR